MKTLNTTNRLILASASPRRKQLLEQAGIAFIIYPADIDENIHLDLPPQDHVTKLSMLKAAHVSKHHPDQWILGADTIVSINGQMLGKPDSRQQAFSMLETLSGNTHQVYTGFSILHNTRQISVSSCVKTDVTFKQLSIDEINWYLDTAEPYDKAGSYAIQGIGSFFVKSIQGSFTNVVGLPVSEVTDILKTYKMIDYGTTHAKKN